MARLLGAGDTGRSAVAPGAVPAVLGLLSRIGKARWHATGRKLVIGEERAFLANLPPDLPPKSGIILGDAGPWYVDAETGAVGRVRLRHPVAAPNPPPSPKVLRPAALQMTGKTPPASRPPTFHDRPRARRADPVSEIAADPVILERPVTPVLRLRRVDCPDDSGRMAPIDALTSISR